MFLFKGVFRKTRRLCALVLALSLVFTSISFAEGNTNASTEPSISSEDNSSNGNTTNNVEEKKSEDEDKKENKSEEEKSENKSDEEGKTDKEEEKKDDPSDDNKEEKEDKKDEPEDDKDLNDSSKKENLDEQKDSSEKTDVEKKATASDATSEEEKANEEEKESDEEKTINEVIATKSDADENNLQEVEIASPSDALLGTTALTWYNIKYHYVLPNNTRNSLPTIWTELFEGRDYAYTFQRMYYCDYHYDEMDNATAYGDGFGSPVGGIFSSYNTYDIVMGYDLVGWNTDEEAAKNGIKTYDVSPAKENPVTTVNQSTVDLYAVFEAIPITIAFDINDERKGSGSTRANVDDPASKTLYWGDPLSFLDEDDYTSATINRPGYDRLLGWSKYTYFSLYKYVTDEDMELAHISQPDISLMSSSQVCDKSMLPSTWNGSSKVWKPGMTIKLYACWQPKVYKVRIHWPMLNPDANYNYEQLLEKCREAAAAEGEEFLMVFDNDLEAVQQFNYRKGYSNPMRVMHLISEDFFIGVGTDPNCTDVTSVKLTMDSYWYEQLADNTVMDLNYILTDNVYRDSVRVKIDLNGGFHRMWTQYDIRIPIGTSYNGMFYTGLMSNLQRPGFTLQKLVKVNPDGSEVDFDPDQEVTASDKSAEVLALMEQYDQAVKNAEPVAERYYAKKKRGMEMIQDAKESSGGIEELYASNEFKQFVEEFETLEREYYEALANIPYLEMVRAYDLIIKCVWTGKQLKGTFNYGGNRQPANKVQGRTLTSKIVTYGERIGDLPTPSSNGYTFRGWKTGRGLGAQYAWKDVTEDTIFDKAELFESELLQMNYDEREFDFYADWEPITINLGITDNEYDEAEVTFGNEFKFGEPSVLDVHGEWTVSSPSTLTGSRLFGSGDEQVKEVYGIEVLDDYYTDLDTPTQKQAAGTRYYNGDTVTLYKNAGETLRIKPIWRDKQENNTPVNPSQPNQPSQPSNSYTPSNSSSSPSGGSSSSSSSSGVTLPLQNTNQQVVQQTLQQTMNSGKFEKSIVNTASLDIKAVNAATSSWKVDPATGKWSLSGLNVFGQSTAPVNCFCQVNTVLAQDVYGMKAGDTVTDTYYFDAAGNMVTGWMQTSDNKWYFFSDQKDGNEGKMSIGWTKVAGNWYYFTSNGSLLTSGTTPDGKKVDANGIVETV